VDPEISKGGGDYSKKKKSQLLQNDYKQKHAG
jgi:hypothetical protein